jgi:hypothetical protein
MLVRPSRRFERAPVIFGSGGSRPNGITRRYSTQLSDLWPACSREGFLTFGILGLFDCRISDYPMGCGGGERAIGSDDRGVGII